MTEHLTGGFRTIVVGYDGSAHADDGVALAQRLLAPGGRLVLVNVFPFYRGWALSATPGAYATVLYEASQATLEALSDTLGPHLHRTLVPLADSSAARGLDDVAEREHADLIVLGSAHRRAARRLAGRTTVQRLLHGAPCAVALAAPGQRRDPHPLRVIGVAYDASDEARAALLLAYDLAARDGGAVRVVEAAELDGFGPSAFTALAHDEHVRDAVRERAQRDVDEAVAVAPLAVEVEGRVLSGQPVARVLEACADVDLLVCGSRSYGPLHRALVGSVSMGIAGRAEVPVLIVPRVHGAAALPAPAVAGAASDPKES